MATLSCFVWTDREFPVGVDSVRYADPPVSCDPPTLEETRRAVKQLKSRKVPGGCGIHSEMLKAEKPPPFCGCTLCCVPSGSQGSSRPTGDGALSVRSGRESGTTESVTTTGGYPPPCNRQGPSTNSSRQGRSNAADLTSVKSSLVSHQRSLP